MKLIVRLVSLVVTLAVLAAAAAWLVPAKKLAEIAAAQVEARTGRALAIGGSVVPQVWPVLGVVAEDVTLANAGWSDGGPMFRAKRLEIGLDAAKLIGGEVRVTALVADAPEILLERAADGRGNWEMAAPAAASAPAPKGGGGGSAAGGGSSLPPVALDRVEVTGGRLVFFDHAAGTRVELRDIALRTAVPDLAGPVGFDLTAVLNGQAFAVTGRVAALDPFLGGKVEGLTAELVAGAARLRFDGRAGLSPLAAEGALDADLADLSALSALAGIERPALPAGLGQSRVTVAGQATLTAEASAHLRGGKVGLDGNAMAVEADYTPGEARPRLVATVSAGALDLSALTGGSGGASGGGAAKGGTTGAAKGGAAKGGAAAGGWPEVAIDGSALGALDAEITLAAQALDLGILRLAPVKGRLSLDRARAVVDLAEAGAYGGGISGQVVANAREGFSARADLALEGLDMQALLAQLAGFDRLKARGTLRFNLLGSGDTLAALMKSLAGEGSLALGQGEYRGLDLAGMLMNLDPSYVGPEDKTIFDGVSASFTVAKGVLSNDDLKLQAPLVSVTGAGEVDIGRQRLDYRLKPVALAGTAGKNGVMVPLIVKGPWSSPDLKLDVEAIAGDKLDAERAKLEERAKEELAKKAAEELGVEIDPKASKKEARKAARKALEDKAKEEAAKALQDLLGGN